MRKYDDSYVTVIAFGDFLEWPKWPKSLQGPVTWYRQKDCCSKNVVKWRPKDCNVGAETMCSDREFQIWAAATGKARLPTVDCLTGGTTCRLVPAERSARRQGTSAVAHMHSIEYASIHIIHVIITTVKKLTSKQTTNMKRMATICQCCVVYSYLFADHGGYR